MNQLPNYEYISDEDGLGHFIEANKAITWLAFDTEFIGERRYTPLLCLMQIATEKGFYLIDTLKLKNIDVILNIIQDNNIQKITHAGENDYLLLYQLYGITPKNVYDTQIAAGFLGYGYPVSFQKLLSRELRINISKNQTVSDWEKRPMVKQQILYAINDVMHLLNLAQSQQKNLIKMGRIDWVKEECSKWENVDFFQSTPTEEALENNLMQTLQPQEQIFLVRLYEWREAEAKTKNYSREMILPTKLISIIVKMMSAGKKSLLNDRRISEKTITKYWDILNELYQKKISEDDRQILASIPEPYDEDNDQSTLLDLLNFIMKYKCQQIGVSPALFLPRTDFNMMKRDKSFFPKSLANGWRKQALGDDFLQWLKRRNQLNITLQGNKCILEMSD